MIVLGFMLVLAYANNLIVPAWAWVLFGIQVFLEIVSAVAKALKD
jgi:hypothetical protein